MQTILEVNSVDKSYGSTQVLKHCSFQIEKGEIYGMSILLSSHIVEEMRHTADRICILSGGHIKQEFSVAEKESKYGERFEDYVIGLMRRELI